MRSTAEICFECSYDFALPRELEAHEPPEARGLRRDEVRLLVTSRTSERVDHMRFLDLPSLLAPGDLLVVNDSGTLAAEVDVLGSDLVVHLSTEQPDGFWVVELRRNGQPYGGGRAGTRLTLRGGAVVSLAGRYLGTHRRLWVAQVFAPGPLPAYLAEHGRPIRYGHVEREWPLSAYQSVFSRMPGSAEMPSAGRPFTARLLAALAARGAATAPITLHTGVASLELDEPPYAERFVVPAATADLVNGTRAAGGRVVAVGTTVVRALESAADEVGAVAPASGWTDLVIEPGRGVRAVDGLVTGLHEPKASHLLMLEAVGGRRQLERAYQAAVAGHYLWHEFGDLHLLIP